MRIDGFSSQSYPIKRKPRKGQPLLDESVEDSEVPLESAPQATRTSSSSDRISQLPVRSQDMIFQRAMSKNAASALASYLTTAGFVEWETQVLGSVDVWLLHATRRADSPCGAGRRCSQFIWNNQTTLLASCPAPHGLSARPQPNVNRP